MTPDHIPRIARLGPRGYAAFGWSGRGIGPGVTFGRALAQTVVGAREDHLPLAPGRRSAAPLAALHAACIEGGARAVHLASARGG
jgi:glycine/D-amino acid oxidase-like deaminating enzyme